MTVNFIEIQEDNSKVEGVLQKIRENISRRKAAGVSAQVPDLTSTFHIDIENNTHFEDHFSSDLASLQSNYNKEHNYWNKKIKLGWVTSWNCRCGIATYSKHLLDNFDRNIFEIVIFSDTKNIPVSSDEDFVIRCWEYNSQTNLSDLFSHIIDNKIEILVIQFQPAFFDLLVFISLINSLLQRDIKIIIFFHSTANVFNSGYCVSLKRFVKKILSFLIPDISSSGYFISNKTIAKTLGKVNHLFVHSTSDLERFKDFGLISNVTLFPHGVMPYDFDDSLFIKKQLSIDDKIIIATYGFLLPHKGILELIKAFYQLTGENQNLHLLLINSIYPIPESIYLKEECIKLINELGLSKKVTMINEFLSDDESMLLLKCADIIVFPYQNTLESASGAVRQGIASLKPVVCSPLPIFEDVRSIVHFLPGTSPDQIYNGLSELLENENLLFSKEVFQKKWMKDNSWDVLSNRLQTVIQSLIKNGLY